MPPVLSEPFDADDCLFELKWDGIRSLAFVERQKYWLTSRQNRQMHEQFPEFRRLADLPPGTVLDGEVVVLRDGRPSFEDVMRRHRGGNSIKVDGLSRLMPAVYVCFDLLYDRHRPLLDVPLVERRERLRRLLAKAGHESLAMSEGVVAAAAITSTRCARGSWRGWWPNR